jgi:Skp family chaperone for outer membrane proteins
MYIFLSKLKIYGANMFFNSFKFSRSLLFVAIFTLSNINVIVANAISSETTAINSDVKIAVVDYPILFSESNKGKELIQKLKNKYEPMHKKIQEHSKDLAEAEQKLQVNRQSLSLAEIQKENSKMKYDYDLLQIEEQLFQDSRIKDEEEARKSMQVDIETSIKKIAEVLGVSIVVERNSILYCSKQLDITRDVLQDLNK